KKFDVSFFGTFDVVINALDNRALESRSHVNKMCLKAAVPLIDAGTAGYLGQVAVYKKDVTECYDCLPHPVPETYPTCTIRNNPSKLIHCIVWAKYLYEILFFNCETDIFDSDLGTKKSTADLNPLCSASSLTSIADSEGVNGLIKKLITLIFIYDVKKLREIDSLWETHAPPSALSLELIASAEGLVLTSDEISLIVAQNDPLDVTTWVALFKNW
ncbi:hypothetical protein MXB_5097, partial [Myxobolus squamalis]